MDRVGVVWGTGIGGFETIEHDISEAALATGESRYSPFLIPKLIGDIAPGHISIKYGFRGINFGTVSAGASSTHSIIASFDYIRMGRADVMVTGGSEAAITKASEDMKTDKPFCFVYRITGGGMVAWCWKPSDPFEEKKWNSGRP